MRLCPPADRGKRLDECFTGRGQRVFDPRWSAFEYATGHESIALEAAKHLRQHLVRNSLDASTQFAKAMGSIREKPDDERGPLVGDSIQCLPGRTALGVDVVLKVTDCWEATWNCLLAFHG